MITERIRNLEASISIQVVIYVAGQAVAIIMVLFAERINEKAAPIVQVIAIGAFEALATIESITISRRRDYLFNNTVVANKNISCKTSSPVIVLGSL